MTFDPRWKFPQGKSPEHLFDTLYQLIRELRKGDYLSGVTGGGGLFQPLDADLTAIAALTTTSFGRGLLELADADALLALIDAIGLQHTNLTITVGSGGDFATLNEALEEASRFRPIYASGGVSVTVDILTGYEETEGVEVVGHDLSYITITAADDPVPATVTGDLFHCENGDLPNLMARFDMDGVGGHGVWLAQAGGVVGEGAGVINAGKSGLYSIANGRPVVTDADFSGAQEFGAFLNHNSVGQLGNTDFSGAGQAGGTSTETGAAYNGIHVRHSSLANLSDATNAQLGGSPSANDLAVSFGGIVDITDDFIGGTSQAVNVVTQHGAIFNGQASDADAIANVLDFLNLATSDSPEFAGVNIGHASDTTLSRLSAGVAGIEAGAIPGVLFKALTGTASGANSSAAQPWFPSAGGVTLAGSTTYFFDGLLYFTRSAGTNAHNISFLFGGTATLTSIMYQINGFLTGDSEGDAVGVATSAAAQQVTGDITDADSGCCVRVTGTVRVNAAGTLIPQFKFSAAPGGAPTIQTNTFFRIYPVGNNTIGSLGTWP